MLKLLRASDTGHLHGSRARSHTQEHAALAAESWTVEASVWNPGKLLQGCVHAHSSTTATVPPQVLSLRLQGTVFGVGQTFWAEGCGLSP